MANHDPEVVYLGGTARIPDLPTTASFRTRFCRWAALHRDTAADAAGADVAIGIIRNTLINKVLAPGKAVAVNCSCGIHSAVLPSVATPWP